VLLLDVLESFGSFLFVDNAFALSVLDILQDLVMSLSLLLELGAFLLQLELKELLFLLEDSLVFLPALVGMLDIVLSSFNSLLKLRDSLRASVGILY
jgi:membrane protein CcdC involved in cytochrome C biogenesis